MNTVKNLQHHRQTGATTLVTVMVLFFVMALVAAYANRNLIVEQRVAMTYQSLGIATEGSNQAISRILSMLNSGNVDDSCQASGMAGQPLRERLLNINASGLIRPLPLVGGGGFTVVCDRARPNGDWICQCPAGFDPELVAPSGGSSESLLARFVALPAAANAAGRIALSAQTCADSSAKCEKDEFTEVALINRTQHLQLLGALKNAPVSPLVATGKIDLGTGLQVLNNDAERGGVAIQAGAMVDGTRDKVHGPAGSPATTAIVSEDAVLAPLNADLFFRRFFGMGMSEYVSQPAMRRLRCDAGCAASLRDLVASGIRMVWHDGDLTLSDEVKLGSPEKPVILVVKGRLTINGPLQLHGLVFSQGDLQWSNASVTPSLVQGAVLVAGNVQADSGATALYDPVAMNALRLQTGSYIRLPGGSRRTL